MRTVVLDDPDIATHVVHRVGQSKKADATTTRGLDPPGESRRDQLGDGSSGGNQIAPSLLGVVPNAASGQAHQANDHRQRPAFLGFRNRSHRTLRLDVDDDRHRRFDPGNLVWRR